VTLQNHLLWFLLYIQQMKSPLAAKASSSLDQNQLHVLLMLSLEKLMKISLMEMIRDSLVLLGDLLLYLS
jgi:hypothetical protein